MGTNDIPTAIQGATIPASHHNSLQEAMANDIVPRNTSGVATANQGSLGTVTLPFKTAKISTGYFFPGQLIAMHTYNGLLTPGQGWMKCDGRIVNQTNYDAEHGAGSWVALVGSSLLDGKYLPDMTLNKYLTGAAATAQDGTAPIAKVGNTNSQITVADHDHTVANHVHQWHDLRDANNTGTFDSNGNAIALPAVAGLANFNYLIANYQVIGTSTGTGDRVNDAYTSSNGGQTSSADGGITNKNIQPESVEAVYYMRIVS